LEDVIRVKDQFYVLATSALADDRTRVLKYGETFAVFNRLGDIESVGLGEHGLYHEETRYLSRFVLRLGRRPPQFLRSSIREDNALLSVDMMNLDISRDDQVVVPRGTVHLFRSKFLWKNVCYEYLRLANYGLTHVDTFVSFDFQSDFADIFEVRGTKRGQRGQMLAPSVTNNTVTLAYQGRDEVIRRTKLEFFPEPTELMHDQAQFRISLQPKNETTIYIIACCERERCATANALTFEGAQHELAESLNRAGVAKTRVITSNRAFGAWISRSEADIHMMIAGNPEGDYPYAGVPWFNTVFGRDGIITAMECLWLAPAIAKSVLKFLAETQATEVNAEEDAEPGKILHEMRRGEMAVLGEIPFRKYYGSIDVTPLYIMLAGAYLARTDDLQFIRSIWPNVLAALDWIKDYGDRDGDGFIEYESRSKRGLVQQGWKDSYDSISHADGSLAEPPIALCEVQGYVYAARRAAARMATALGDVSLAQSLVHENEALRERFDRAFWSQDLGTYVLALDGDKRPCVVKASNAGHCLFSGIARMERAASTMRALMSEEMFCGWGIRTLGSNEVRYNPLSYHNGSVWPHDNAIVARGFSLYGLKNEALAILDSLMQASAFLELNRLPELFCGCHRRSDSGGPTLYPVACSPQSWAAGSVYMLLEAILGLEVNPKGKSVRFWHPCLPDSVDELGIENLTVAESSADILLTKSHGQVVPTLLRHTGDVRVELISRGS
jgi:glycogen debranching enzyme